MPSGDSRNIYPETDLPTSRHHSGSTILTLPYYDTSQWQATLFGFAGTRTIE